jgi:hypothetical protein
MPESGVSVVAMSDHLRHYGWIDRSSDQTKGRTSDESQPSP